MQTWIRKVVEPYRIDEDHAFVLETQELGQVLEITIKLLKQSIHLGLLDLNYEVFGTFFVLGRDHQVTRENTKSALELQKGVMKDTYETTYS